MTRKLEISRDEGEYLVDVLESLTDSACGEHHRALYLSAELRELFGMKDYEPGEPPRYPELRGK